MYSYYLAERDYEPRVLRACTPLVGENQLVQVKREVSLYERREETARSTILKLLQISVNAELALVLRTNTQLASSSVLHFKILHVTSTFS